MVRKLIKMRYGYRYKMHWKSARQEFPLRAYSHCGKLLPQWAFAERKEDITCKVCRKPFFYA